MLFTRMVSSENLNSIRAKIVTSIWLCMSYNCFVYRRSLAENSNSYHRPLEMFLELLVTVNINKHCRHRLGWSRLLLFVFQVNFSENFHRQVIVIIIEKIDDPLVTNLLSPNWLQFQIKRRCRQNHQLSCVFAIQMITRKTFEPN